MTEFFTILRRVLKLTNNDKNRKVSLSVLLIAYNSRSKGYIKSFYKAQALIMSIKSVGKSDPKKKQ